MSAEPGQRGVFAGEARSKCCERLSTPSSCRRSAPSGSSGCSSPLPRRRSSIRRSSSITAPATAPSGRFASGTRGWRWCGSRPTSLLARVQPGAERGDGDVLVLLNDDCVVDPGSSRRSPTRSTTAGSGDGRRGDARLGRRRRDRQRRDGARPDPAGLRLPERRAGLATRRGRRGSDRPRPRPRRSTAPRSALPAGSTSGCSRTGRTSTWCSGCAGGLPLRAGSRSARRSRAFRQPGLGLGAKELPDGLRPRLRAAQVARAHRRPAGRSAGARRNPLRRPGDRRPQRRRAARSRRRVSGGPRPSPTRPSWSTRRRRASAPTSCGASSGGPGCVPVPRASVRPTRALAVFHLADTSGPSRSLEAELGWLGGEVDLDIVIPGAGNLEAALGPVADVTRAEYEAPTAPSRGRGGLTGSLRRLARGSRLPRADPRPAARPRGRRHLDAAGGHDRGPGARSDPDLLRRAVRPRPRDRSANAGRPLVALTGRLADGIIACSRAVAERLPARRGPS